MIFAVGLVDDLRPISAPAKVTGIVVAGAILAWFGVTMFYFRVPFSDVYSIGADWVPLITVIWLLLMANAVNLIDGLDGLAAGIVAIASGTFFLYSQQLNDAGRLEAPNIGPLLAVITLGMCVGFLPHNFNPARIFMGDGGALLLGLMMAASTSVVGGRSDPNEGFSGQTYFFLAPLVIPLLILGVPILDFLYAVIRRAAGRSGLTVADKNHLHHRLMRLGHGQRRSVLILWLWTALLSGLVLYPTYTGEGDAFVPLGVAALALILYTVLHPEVRRSREDVGARARPSFGPGAAARWPAWSGPASVPAPAPARPAAGRPGLPHRGWPPTARPRLTITPKGRATDCHRIRPAITPSGMPIRSPTRASVAACTDRASYTPRREAHRRSTARSLRRLRLVRRSRGRWPSGRRRRGTRSAPTGSP